VLVSRSGAGIVFDLFRGLPVKKLWLRCSIWTGDARKWGRIASVVVLRLGERAAVNLPTSTMVVSRTPQRHYWETHGAETSYVPNGGLLRELRVPDKILSWRLETESYILYRGRFLPKGAAIC
jgi:hypothetical protein